MKRLEGIINKLKEHYKEMCKNMNCDGHCDICVAKYGKACISMTLKDTIEDLDTINVIIKQIERDLR